MQNRTIDNEPKLFFSTLRNSKEFLAIIVSIITSVIFILTQIGALEKLNVTENQVLAGIDVFNIAILAIALLLIRATPLLIEQDEFRKLRKHLTLNNEEEKFDGVLSRVNVLIEQLVNCIRWFCLILALFYLLQLFTDTKLLSFDLVKQPLNDNHTIFQLFSNQQTDAAVYLGVEMLTNLTNLFSAAYLFVAFQVLFLVTLEDDNKTWKLKSYIPLSIAFSITLLNIFCVITGFYGANLLIISHVIRLAGGIYNGVAMFLLFSRFVSMEYFFQNSSETWQKNFYFYGTIIVLPLYVVAQPLYGLFNANEIGSPALFKSIVFLICFWGKLVFLLFVFTMLTKKWIHSYLFLVLSQKDTILNISKDLKDVDDLKQPEDVIIQPE